MCLSELMSSDPNKLHHTLYLPLKPAHTPLTLCCHMKKELQKGYPALDCKVFFGGGTYFCFMVTELCAPFSLGSTPIGVECCHFVAYALSRAGAQKRHMFN